MKDKRYKCMRCGITKPASSYYFNKSRVQKLHSRCKKCEKERYPERREYFIKYMQKNRIENKIKWDARVKAQKELKK